MWFCSQWHRQHGHDMPRCCGLVVWEQVGHRLSIPGVWQIRPSHELDNSLSLFPRTYEYHWYSYCIMHIYIYVYYIYYTCNYTVCKYIYISIIQVLYDIMINQCSQNCWPPARTLHLFGVLGCRCCRNCRRYWKVIRRHTHSMNVKEIGISNYLLGVYMYKYIYIHTHIYIYKYYTCICTHTIIHILSS